jgi:uncharacterized membrane protein
MKILKTILAVVAVIILIVLVAAAFAPKTYTLEKSVTINAPRQKVFGYMRSFSNQNEFSSWFRMDPSSKTSVSGPDGEVGATYAWESDKTGQGEQKLIALSNGETLFYELTFIKPFEGKAASNMYFSDAAQGQTTVRNTFSSGMPYPMNALLLVMNMDNSIGKELQNTLNNAKDVLEKN